jgi:hypothetical protein
VLTGFCAVVCLALAVKWLREGDWGSPVAVGAFGAFLAIVAVRQVVIARTLKLVAGEQLPEATVILLNARSRWLRPKTSLLLVTHDRAIHLARARWAGHVHVVEVAPADIQVGAYAQGHDTRLVLAVDGQLSQWRAHPRPQVERLVDVLPPGDMPTREAPGPEGQAWLGL